MIRIIDTTRDIEIDGYLFPEVHIVGSEYQYPTHGHNYQEPPAYELNVTVYYDVEDIREAIAEQTEVTWGDKLIHLLTIWPGTPWWKDWDAEQILRDMVHKIESGGVEL